ncbi:hypothetical protein K8R33_03450 [archaeon]|nr:hypothetical protein [archaeon]
MRNKRVGIVMILLIFIISFVGSVSALGITPARKIVDFESGLEQTVEFYIVNSEGKDMKVVVYAENVFEGGEIVVGTPEIIFSSEEDRKKVNYTFKLPEEFKIPGKQIAKMVVREIPMDVGEIDGTVIGASVAIIHQLIVEVPFPGKYAVAELKITETGLIDSVDFVVSLINLGIEDINSASGVIEIFDAFSDEKVTTLETDLFSVNSGDKKENTVVWTENIEIGKYYAKLKLNYDGNVVEADREFTVGARMVELLYIFAKNFKLGDIAKFNILVENKWSDSIHDVYTEFLISKLGGKIANFKSATEDIEGESTKELTAYWDTEGVEGGEYGAKITLRHDDEALEMDVKTIITSNSITFDGLTGAVTSGGLVNTNFVVGAIVLVIVTSLFWFVWFKFRKKK